MYGYQPKPLPPCAMSCKATILANVNGQSNTLYYFKLVLKNACSMMSSLTHSQIALNPSSAPFIVYFPQ